MPETEHSQINLAAIRTRLDGIEAMQRLMAASSKEVRGYIERVLGSKKNAAEVYLLLAERPHNPEELIAKTKLSPGTISKVCSHLEIDGMIIKHRDPKNPKKALWAWTDAETIFGVSKIARRIISKGAASPSGSARAGTSQVQAD